MHVSEKRFKYCQRQYRIYSSNGISQSSPSPFSPPSKSSFLRIRYSYTHEQIAVMTPTNSSHAMTPSDNEKRGESTQSFIPSFPIRPAAPQQQPVALIISSHRFQSRDRGVECCAKHQPESVFVSGLCPGTRVSRYALKQQTPASQFQPWLLWLPWQW